MRTVFMAYLTGSIEAVDFYCGAFNAEKACFKAGDDDFCVHAEIKIDERVVMAICDTRYYKRTGNYRKGKRTHQFKNRLYRRRHVGLGGFSFHNRNV